MGLCAERRCDCGFTSTSLEIENVNGIISIETYGPGIVATKADVTSPFTNQIVHESNTGLTWMYDGSGWLLYGWTVEPSVKLRLTGAQSFLDATLDVVDYDVEVFDPHGWHSGGAPSRILPTIPGYYQMWCGGSWAAAADYSRLQNSALKNGAAMTPHLADDRFVTISGLPSMFSVFDEIEMNGTTDWLEHQGYQDNTTAAARTFNALCVVRWVRNL